MTVPRRGPMRRLALMCVLVMASTCAPSMPEDVAGDTDAPTRAVVAAERFLDDYLGPDGRVRRVDQGGDTVSEGQAYAMLLAVALGDEQRFREAWAWTDTHLQRADGLLGWHWSGGRLTDAGAATDADLVAAWALGLAGKRFADAELAQEARRIGAAVIGSETVRAGAGRVLVAGPWAIGKRVVNPSYLVVEAMSQLWWLTGDATWSTVAASARRVLDEQTDGAPHLPSDWATVDGAAAPSPDGVGPRFSYDAGRTIVQLAADCNEAGRAMAARPWTFFESLDIDDIVASYSLSGQPIGSDRHPMSLVAAAAAAHAAGDEQHPTYYGAAWIALGRILLDTRRLGGCG